MMPVDIDTGAGARRVDVGAYLDGALVERAHEESHAWIKAVRHATIDGVPFRRRWTFRGDSLWWFAELYLHKEQVVLGLHRLILAFEAMLDRERPLVVRAANDPRGWILRQVAAGRHVRFEGTGTPPSRWTALARLSARATVLDTSARLSRKRGRGGNAAQADVAAFVHSAFWRDDVDDGSAESYIGPVLYEVERQAGTDRVRYIGIGPRSNFRARHWWDPLRRADDITVPIEAFAPLRALEASREYWRTRHEVRRAMWASDDLRAHAVIRGCDCWPAIRMQFAGIALLQFPWSTRVMDEAAAALDVLRPRVAVTYAEAGGWGRALALECRRRGIPFVGLQHGFIYRHWLNYRHEADEMVADPANPSDVGFPRPALTLVYDRHAADHLTRAGLFPESAVRVTGSPRFDELAAAVKATTAAQIAETRKAAGARDGDALVLVATKEREASRVLPDLVRAVRDMPNVHVAIKPHPAETSAVYAAAAGGAANVRVLDSSVRLSDLLAAASLVVTVNSTVAIDALALGVPSLVIGLPNNLSPFVDAGRMAGAATLEEMQASLGRLLYDQEFRRTLLHASREAADRPPLDGSSAARTAAAVLGAARE